MTKSDCRRRTVKHLHSSQNSLGKQIHTSVINPDSDTHWRFVVLIPLVSTSKSHYKCLHLLLVACWKVPLPKYIPPKNQGKTAFIVFKGNTSNVIKFYFFVELRQIGASFSIQSFLPTPRNPRATQKITKMEKENQNEAF